MLRAHLLCVGFLGAQDYPEDQEQVSCLRCAVQEGAAVQQYSGTSPPVVFPLAKRQRNPRLNFCHLPDARLATLTPRFDFLTLFPVTVG